MKLLTDGAAKLGIYLTEEQLFSFRRYHKELSEWNRITNLTSVTGCENVQRRHFLDSLTIVLALGADFLKDSADRKLLDVGSGAGFPGLPLAIALPTLKVTLLESTSKKSRFLEHMVGILGLDNVLVITGRAEELAHRPEMRERYDYAVERGVGKLATLAEIMLPFCEVGGAAIAIKGAGIDEEVEQALPAIERMGGRLNKVINAELEELERPTGLVVVAKEHPTPPNYPRRSGIPFKRPILL